MPSDGDMAKSGNDDRTSRDGFASMAILAVTVIVIVIVVIALI